MPRKILALLLKSIPGRSSIAALAALSIWQGADTQAAVTAGGIAIIGYTDESTGGTDYFSVAALEEIVAETTVYFTDNGWIASSGQFRGAHDPLIGDGTETLIKLHFTANVAAGTIMRSGFDDIGFEWDASSSIPGSTTGNFDFLGLASVQSGSGTTGEQIYAFEAGDNPMANLPMHNPTNHVYVLDMGDFNNQGFEDILNDTFDGSTGAIPPGLLEANNTAVSLPDGAAGDDANDFHNGSFALNMSDPDVLALNSTSGTKAQWLAVIADSTNWLKQNFDGFTDVDSESQLSTLNITPVPEPSRALLVALGGFALVLRRRRK